MSVRICPIADSVRIQVTGDVETVVSVPYDDDDRFLLGFSDGTLLIGAYDDHLACSFEVAHYGAAIVRIDSDGVTLDCSMEWVTVANYDPNIIHPPIAADLPLFPELDQKAA